MDPFTFDLLSGPPLPAAFSTSCGKQPTTGFDVSHFAATPVPRAAILHDFFDLPATSELYAAALDAHLAVTPVLQTAIPHGSFDLPATCELYAAALDAHLAATPVPQAAVFHGSFDLPATSDLYAAALDAHLAATPVPQATVFHGSFDLPATSELYAAALDAHLAPTPVPQAAVFHGSFDLPATSELYAAALDAHLLHPTVAGSKNSTTTTRPRLPEYEYDADIDVNLREMEKKAKQRPSPDYLNTVQGGRMSKSRRAELVSWMEDFTWCFDLAPGTLHRAVSYVDRILSKRALPLSPTHLEHELHLLGGTAVYTAAKYEEQSTRYKVNAKGVAEICGSDTTKEEVIDMEFSMLAALHYDLSGPTAYTFVDHFTRHSGGGEQDLEVQRLAHQLAQRSLLDYRLLQLLPSQVAASAVFLARLILNPMAIQVQQWNKDFEELTGYKPRDIIIGIESLYMTNHDPRFDVVPTFLEGQLIV